MQLYLSRLFKIRHGEWRIVLILQLQIFLIIAVLLIAKPAGNALFLSRFGSGALPYMYILTALVAAGVSTAYSTALRYFSILRVNLWSMAICIITLLAFGLTIQSTGARDIVAVGLYLWVALFGVLAASQFWLIANLIFDIRQAKRLFGPIGAGAIAGGIAGGYVANLIAVEYGTQPLLFLACILLLPTIFITLYVWRKYIKGKVPKLARRRRRANLNDSPYGIIRNSKHLMLLCGIVTLSVITAKLVDYQFSALALRRFANEDQLTAFFGFWFSTFNVIGLIIQLLLTQRIVKNIGISGALVFLPAGLSLGALMMFIMPGLNTAIFSRLTDGSLKQSLHRAGVEMLFLPVSREVKERIKTYIDVFIDSAAGGMGGLLLLLLVDGLGFSAPLISIPVFILSIGWLLCVLLVRDEYLAAFRSQLQQFHPSGKRRSMQSQRQEVMGGFMKVLSDQGGNSKEKQLLYVLERTEVLGGEEFDQALADLLNHESPKVRARVLRNLTLRDDPGNLDKIIPLLLDHNIEVMNAATEYIITHHPIGARELITEQLKHPEAEVGGATLRSLIIESRTNSTILEYWDLEGKFNWRIEDIKGMGILADRKSWTIAMLEAAGKSTFEKARELIITNFESKDPDLRHAAIVAAGESLDERYLLRVIDYLSEAPDRPHAREALVQYGLGLIDLLPSYFRQDLIEMADVRRLPSVLEHIGSQQSVDLLFAMIAKYFPGDLELRMEAIRSLNSLQRDFPELNMPTSQVFRQLMSEIKVYQLTIENQNGQTNLLTHGSEELKAARESLLKILEQRHNSNKDRLFRLLGLRYKADDIIPIFRALKSDDHSQQINAIEFLENLLDNPLKRLVIPLVEMDLRKGPDATLAIPSKSNLLNAQYKHFRRILRGRDHRLKLTVLHLVSFLEEERYEKLLIVYSQSQNKKIKEVATRSLKTFQERNVN